MNYCFNLHKIKIIIFIIINAINILSVTSKLREIKNEDPRQWSQGSFTEFNNVFDILIDDKYLSNDTDPHKCNASNAVIKNVASDPNYWNACPGIIRSCWINEEPTDVDEPVFKQCFCLCEHNKDFTGAINTSVNKNVSYVFNLPRPKLLDSICFDPIVLEDNFVVTGVRFRQYDNRLHLEVQQGVLANGRVDPITVDWNTVETCTDSRKILYDFSGALFKSIKLVLEDIPLPENFVVTGVTFGESLIGRSVNYDGNFDSDTLSITQMSHCTSSTTSVLKNYKILRPSTSASQNNQELSQSCKHHIEFHTTSFEINYEQHIVPSVDLQELVTDPPMPISGIGWYYRGYPNCGGYLALKILKA
ncbi:uncharacterized protein LOC103574050 [Microplitis demolitor]|uniref:uncharacterized protein LOC103574050 n=1 Tax=Microplitis demolitor TaxID=69319 RepID=UPI0004CD7B3A|nr:uncharacterized protein LOC103574050 [Microplitis demolitor]